MVQTLTKNCGMSCNADLSLIHWSTQTLQLRNLLVDNNDTTTDRETTQIAIYDNRKACLIAVKNSSRDFELCIYYLES